MHMGTNTPESQRKEEKAMPVPVQPATSDCESEKEIKKEIVQYKQDLQAAKGELQEMKELLDKKTTFMAETLVLKPHIHEARDIIVGYQEAHRQLQNVTSKTNHILRSISVHRPAHRHVHLIALQLIFEAIFPPSGFLDSSLGPGPRSPWSKALRAKKTLCLVCKHWQHAALPILYGEIILRRVGQISALARTVRSNPALFGPLIRHISVHFSVPASLWSVVQSNMVYILEQCHHVQTLSIGTLFMDTMKDNLTWNPIPENSVIQASIRENTTLTLYVDIVPSWGKTPFDMPLLMSFPNLVSLALFSTKHSSTGHPWGSTESIRLPRLEVLSLDGHATTYLKGMLNWDMPLLRRCCLDYSSASHYTSTPVSFFSKYGPRIKELIVSFPFYAAESHTRSIRSILQLCTSVRYIAIDDYAAELPEFDFLLSPSSQAQVDIWITEEKTSRGGGIIPKVMTDGHVRPHIRLVDVALKNLRPHLPSLLPRFPTDQPTDPPIVHNASGLCFVQTSWCLFRSDFDFKKRFRRIQDSWVLNAIEMVPLPPSETDTCAVKEHSDFFLDEDPTGEGAGDGHSRAPARTSDCSSDSTDDSSDDDSYECPDHSDSSSSSSSSTDADPSNNASYASESSEEPIGPDYDQDADSSMGPITGEDALSIFAETQGRFFDGPHNGP